MWVYSWVFNSVPLVCVSVFLPITIYLQRHMHAMFIAALFTVSKTWGQWKCSLIDDWIKKMRYMYTMEHYSGIREYEILSFATTWMDLKNIMLSEISQKKLRTVWFHSYVGYKTESNKWRNKKDTQTKTRRHRQWYGWLPGGRGWRALKSTGGQIPDERRGLNSGCTRCHMQMTCHRNVRFNSV